MSKHLLRDLENLQRQVLVLAGSVEESIYRAIQSLQDRSKSIAHAVITGDSRIDELEIRVMEESLKLLALHQPVARDLRRITTVMMITTDLERMADLAADIAEHAIVLLKYSSLPIPGRLQRMTDLTTTMVRQSLDAFVNLDCKLARRVIRMDREVDDFEKEMAHELTGMMKQAPENIDMALSMLTVVRDLERIGDHATNVAEDVVYLVEGELVRHRHEAMPND